MLHRHDPAPWRSFEQVELLDIVILATERNTRGFQEGLFVSCTAGSSLSTRLTNLIFSAAVKAGIRPVGSRLENLIWDSNNGIW